MAPSIFRGDPLPAPGRPLWTDLDQAEAVALVLEEGGECSGCGLPLEETTVPGAESRLTVDELLCAGCMVRAARAEDGKPYAGRMLHVHRKPDQLTTTT